MNQTEKTIDIYCRVSTEEQASSGLSLEHQEKNAAAFIWKPVDSSWEKFIWRVPAVKIWTVRVWGVFVNACASECGGDLRARSDLAGRRGDRACPSPGP